MKVGTGFAQGCQPVPELAAWAVSQAMDRAGLDIANGVLLFLSEDFAQNPQPALQAAAVAASTMQVSGCSAPGIFTQDEWVLDGSAAAALVLGDGAGISTVRSHEENSLLLTLAAPNALNASWLQWPGKRFGCVAGDATGHGQFSVWTNGKGIPSGYTDLLLQGVRGVVDVAHAIKPLGMPQQVGYIAGFDVLEISGQPAWMNLVNTLDDHGVSHDQGIPYHRLVAILAESEEAYWQEEYHPVPLVSADMQAQSVTLATKMTSGTWLTWGMLDRDAAQQQLAATVQSINARLQGKPAFGLVFSCLARGPHLYDGVEQEISLLKRDYPGLPLIGFYGNGEIAPIHDRNVLCQQSVVLGLFTAES